jgi:hypothetical protein
MKTYALCLLFILSLTPICRADSDSSDTYAETNRIKAVAVKCAELLENDQLPGLSHNDHGDIHGYQLTSAMKKALVEKKLINDEMLDDVKGYRDSYIMGVVTKDNRNYAYFFYVANGDVRLVSAYHFEANVWVKIRR